MKRIIAKRTLSEFWVKHANSEQYLKTWHETAKNSKWNSPNDVKNTYVNASILKNNRVVFNIKGNDFRLVVDIEYRIGIAFIVWIGTHKEYDKVNILELKYE